MSNPNNGFVPNQGFDNGMQGNFNQQMPMGGQMPPMGGDMQQGFGGPMPQQMSPMGGQMPPMGGQMPQGFGGPMPQQMPPMGGQMPQGFGGQMPPMGGQMQQGFGGSMPPMGGQTPLNNQMPIGGGAMPGMQQIPNLMPQANSLNAMKQTIIAVNCPKGGVGKTTISKELAIAFATARVNGNPLKVCLVDGNIGFGDVTTMLKIPSMPNIKMWTSDIQRRLSENPDIPPRYNQQTIESEFLIQHQSGLYVLAAPSSHTDSLDIDAEQMGIVIDNLKECNFDIIIIDTANNTSDYTLIALEKAQTILMVSTLEITSIQDTRCLLTTLREIQFPIEKIKLVINKMPQKAEKDIDLNEVSAVLQVPILGVIPDFPKVRLINNNGQPAMMGKDNELTLAIKDLANKIVPVFATNKKGAPVGFGGAGGDGQKKSLFGGLFGKKK